MKKDDLNVEAWVYRVVRDGVSLWMRQDGMGEWLVTAEFHQHPERYLTIDGTWTDKASPDTRHSEGTARSLAIGHLLGWDPKETR